jgi:hypothetical protein
MKIEAIMTIKYVTNRGKAYHLSWLKLKSNISWKIAIAHTVAIISRIHMRFLLYRGGPCQDLNLDVQPTAQDAAEQGFSI